MPELVQYVRALRRPATMIRAARLGMARYSRDRHIGAMLRLGRSTPQPQIVSILAHEEAAIEQSRRADDGSYSARRHLHIMIALVAEAEAMLRPQPVT